MTGRFHIIPSAAEQITDLAIDSERQFGKERTARYLRELNDSFQYIADYYKGLPARQKMRAGSGYMLHHVNKHYVAFKTIREGEIAIAAILHEKMLIPKRLQELEAMSTKEIAELLIII